MATDIISSAFQDRPVQKCPFIDLPAEILAKICGYIVPIDRTYILLLATEGDTENASRDDGFFFDRGYGFPVFETSLLRVCSVIYEVCMSLWLGTGKFRLDMGENLGPRKGLVFLPDRFMRKIVHCELQIVLPFHPLFPRNHEDMDGGLIHGSWLLRVLLRRLLAPLKEGNLRDMLLTVRDKGTGEFHVYRADGVPKALNYYGNSLVQPSFERMDGFYKLCVFGKEVMLEDVESLTVFVWQLNFNIEQRLVIVARRLAEGMSDEETILLSFPEDFTEEETGSEGETDKEEEIIIEMRRQEMS